MITKHAIERMSRGNNEDIRRGLKRAKKLILARRVPNTDWYLNSGGIIICGYGCVIKTILSKGMNPRGENIS